MKQKDLEKTKRIYFALGYENGIKDTIANLQNIICKLDEKKLYEIADDYIQDMNNALCDEHISDYN